jgi:hypothetical protein
VPGKRDSLLESALADLGDALNASRADWMVIGGIAVIARGVRRMTTDIDAAVRGDQIDAAALLRVLATNGITPRIDDAESFARESLVLLLRHDATGVELDVSMTWTDFEWKAIDRASNASFGRTAVRMATPEDLIVYKVIAGRPKDLEDVTGLLVLYPDVELAPIREHVRVLAALAEQTELALGLETAVATSRKMTRSATARRKPSKAKGKTKKKAKANAKKK